MTTMSVSALTKMGPDRNPEGGDGNWSPRDVLGIIDTFDRMLLAMEARLVAKIDESTRQAAERWVSHDTESTRYRTDANNRFERIEQSLLTVEKTLRAHLEKERDEDLVIDARIRPLKAVGIYIFRNWRTILLVMLTLLALFGLSEETIRRVVL